MIGSGYGGAISACRLAQQGFSVCVLERGREHLPGMFPESVGAAAQEVLRTRLLMLLRGCVHAIYVLQVAAVVRECSL